MTDYDALRDELKAKAAALPPLPPEVVRRFAEALAEPSEDAA